MNGIQYIVYLIPDYRPDESLFVYKVHHSICDGIANILFFNDMTDNPKVESYPNILPRFSFVQSIFIKACMPFYIIWLNIKVLFIYKEERNGFKTDEVCQTMSAKKIAEFIPDICLDDVK